MVAAMLKTLFALTLVTACGGSQHSGGKTYTCEEAATQMADYFHQQTRQSGDAHYGELGDKAAATTRALCKADRWSTNAIFCIGFYNEEGPHGCVATGWGVGDLPNDCPISESLPTSPAYGPKCTGFTKAQADAYRKAMIEATTCDPGIVGTIPNKSGVPVHVGIGCPKL